MKRIMLLFAVVSVFSSVARAQRVLRIPPVRAGAVPPDVAATDADPSFPVRVHLLATRWGGLASVYHGYGSGNLVDGQGAAGFDYGFECEVPFVANESPQETYQARWKGPFKLEILTTEVGAQPHFHTCTLDLAMEKRAFEPANTAAL